MVRRQAAPAPAPNVPSSPSVGRGHETALLGKLAQFECSVDSGANAAEVQIWWQVKGKNITKEQQKFQVKS